MRRPLTKTALASILFAGALLAVAVAAEAQQPKKVPRIGFLSAASPSAISDRLDSFRQGLNELGYIEGKNIAVDYRYAEGKADRLPSLAAELVAVSWISLFLPLRRAFWPLKRHQRRPRCLRLH